MTNIPKQPTTPPMPRGVLVDKVKADTIAVWKAEILEREHIRAVLEDIKREIVQHCCITVGIDNEPAMTLHDVFEIIEKHISGKER